MRRIADLYSGEAKTDAPRDAFVIADAARVMPHTLRSVDLEDETIAELEMIVGFDDEEADSGGPSLGDRQNVELEVGNKWYDHSPTFQGLTGVLYDTEGVIVPSSGSGL